jgi:hypothetical protein
MNDRVILCLIIFFWLCLLRGNAQTDSIVLNNFKSLLDWQTPNYQVDSILDQNYIGGKEKFLKNIVENLDTGSLHHDFWSVLYLVTLEVDEGDLKLSFHNNPLNSHRKTISETLKLTADKWRNGTKINLHLAISISNGKEEIVYPYIQVSKYALDYNFPCEYDCCFEYEKEKTLANVKYFIAEEEYFGAVHYLKILARKYPFDYEINTLLIDTLMKLKSEN